MNEIIETILFGLSVLSLVLGLTCIILVGFPVQSSKNKIQEKIEYGVFGVSSLALFSILSYAMS